MSEFEYTDINDPTSGTPAQRAAAEQRAAEIAEAATAHWRAEALKKYPAVTALAEYLNGGSAGEVEELAKDLSEKLGGQLPGNTPAPTPSVGAGSPALDNSYSGESSELTEAREAARKSPTNANYSRYLRAKHAEVGIAYPGDD